MSVTLAFFANGNLMLNVVNLLHFLTNFIFRAEISSGRKRTTGGQLLARTDIDLTKLSSHS
jgi:hypothetical protein